MAAQTNTLEVIDTPPIDYVDFDIQMKRWLSNITDIINANFTTLVTNLLAVSSIDIGGSGAGPIAVSVLGLTPSGKVNVNLLSSSNPVTITDVTPGTDQFTVTFSGDPGASAVIQYVAFTQIP